MWNSCWRHKYFKTSQTSQYRSHKIDYLKCLFDKQILTKFTSIKYHVCRCCIFNVATIRRMYDQFFSFSLSLYQQKVHFNFHAFEHGTFFADKTFFHSIKIKFYWGLVCVLSFSLFDFFLFSDNFFLHSLQNWTKNIFLITRFFFKPYNFFNSVQRFRFLKINLN